MDVSLWNTFSASFVMIIWFFFFNLLVQWVSLTAFWMLSQPYLPGIKPTWLWWIILYIHCWIWCTYILLKIFIYIHRGLVQFSRSVVSDSLWSHESQHARPPCPSPTPGVHSNLRPSSRWCHPAILSSVVPFSSCPQSLPASVFSNESTLRIRWLKYWSFSFSISPSNEHPGLVSFRMD